MIWSLVVAITMPTKMFGNNLGVIQSTDNPKANLKKKTVALSYHMVREAVVARIVQTYHVDSKENFADILTKALPRETFMELVSRIFHRGKAS